MRYTKPPLTFEQQADLLLVRGMVGDRGLMVQRLRSVNYYRLSGYWFPFRNPDATFQPGTTFETVWKHYVFDRRLRLLVLDAVERIEVAVRTQISYHHAHRHGVFAYATDPQSLPKLWGNRWNDFTARVGEETGRASELFVASFRTKYGDMHNALPVWMATEVMAFGTVVTFFLGLEQPLKRQIAAEWGVPDVIFESWLHTLNSVRNICAHHSRLWNRRLPTKPIIPGARKYPDWHTPASLDQNYVFSVLTICKHCLQRVAPQSRWAQRWRALLAEYPEIPLASMGVPADWEQCPIWQ